MTISGLVAASISAWVAWRTASLRTKPWFAAFCVAAIPIATLAAIWLPLRVRFVRRINASQRFIDSAADLELFAVRALAHQPIAALAAIDPDPVARWRAGDPAVIRALAQLELRDEGLHAP